MQRNLLFRFAVETYDPLCFVWKLKLHFAFRQIAADHPHLLFPFSKRIVNSPIEMDFAFPTTVLVCRPHAAWVQEWMAAWAPQLEPLFLRASVSVLCLLPLTP